MTYRTTKLTAQRTAGPLGAGRAILCASVILLTACQSTGPAGTGVATGVAAAAATTGSDFAATETDIRIAENLVSVVGQLNELPPWSSTVQINPPNSSFGTALFNAFEAVGYGVQRVEQDQGINYVSFRSSTEQSESGTLYNYSVWVGGRISVERTFRDVQGELLPSSPITLIGVAPKTINIDDRRYSDNVPAGLEFPTGVIFRDDSYELLAARESITTTSGGNTRASAAAAAASDARIQEILAPYRPKRQATLSFPTAANNVLGDPNKRAIVAISEAYNAATDIFLVSGCRPASFGAPTDPQRDSETRTQRIRAELLNRGYASGVILEETCEPGRYNRELPRRSVVLTLERLRDA